MNSLQRRVKNAVLERKFSSCSLTDRCELFVNTDVLVKVNFTGKILLILNFKRKLFMLSLSRSQLETEEQRVIPSH